MDSNKSATKIVHIIGRLLPGGVEMRTLELIKATSQNDFEHYVYVSSGLPGNLDTRYQEAGARIIYGDIKSLNFFRSFHSFLKTESIDVVHSNLMYTSGWVLFIARIAGVRKRIAHFRSDGKPLAELSNFARLKRQTMRILINFNATDIVGLTPENLDIAWGQTWKNDERCTVIPNGVVIPDLKVAHKAEIVPNSSKKTTIIHIGRGDLPSKNREKAITVTAALIRKYGLDVQLLFVGRDGLTPSDAAKKKAKWEALATHYGISERTFFLGQRSDVGKLLADSDLFLFTSLLEGLPGVVLEARASGVPVIASDLPGVRFIAQQFSDIRVLSPLEDDEIWADSIAQTLGDNSVSRSARQDQFRGSAFDIEVASERFRSLWSR